MKRFLLCGMLLLLSLGVYAARTAERSAVAVLRQLGVSEAVARDHIWSSMAGGYASFPSLREAKKLTSGERASMVPVLGAFARQYTQSQDFKDKYLAYRLAQKPTPPEAQPSSENRRATMKKQLQESLSQAEATMKTMPADQQAIFQQTIAYLKEQLKAVDDPNNPMFSSQMDAFSKQAYESRMAEYRQELAKWEEDYPTDPNPLIRKRLEQFLRESDGVDYSARLEPGPSGKMIFVNPAYESKPGNWKLCYRAGKETMEAARDFARTWLADLQNAK